MGGRIAIDALLLGESQYRVTGFDGLLGLLHRSSGEGPAGAACTLVFDRPNFALLDPIDGLVVPGALVTKAAIAVAVGGGLVFRWLCESLHLCELFIRHITCFVHAEGHSSAGIGAI